MPVLEAGFIDGQLFLVGELRVVMPDRLDGTAVALIAPIGRYEPVMRMPGFSFSLKPYSHHKTSLFFKSKIAPRAIQPSEQPRRLESELFYLRLRRKVNRNRSDKRLQLAESLRRVRRAENGRSGDQRIGSRGGRERRGLEIDPTIHLQTA